MEGKTLNGAAEMPFGVINALETGEAKLLLLSWLAIGEEIAAISDFSIV